MNPPDEIIAAAIEIAKQSPCAKSRRGVVVFAVTGNVYTLGEGFNGPPKGFVCNESIECRKDCAKRCVHAEMRAVRGLIRGPSSGLANVADVLHIEIDANGGLMPSWDGPSCWQCSREMLDVGLRGVWLYEDKWRYYMMEEFHRTTLRHCEVHE